MIYEPEKWSDDTFGGYLNNKLLNEGLITGSAYHGHEMHNKDNLYKAVNYMSAVKFGINNDLFNYLNNEGIFLIKELKDKSEELQRITTLQIAETYSNIPFYLPLQCDWRGRIYTNPFFITYQGGDLSTSLLEFWDGHFLTKSGLDSLYIYGANNYNESNISKDTYPNRIKWVKNNMENILKMEPDFILKAENKFVFTAFCLTIRELNKNPNYLVKLPVWLDATCSGIQILAAILRDLQLAKEVNLIPQDDSKGPSDIYNSLREPINDLIREEGKNNKIYGNLEFVDLTRNDIKTPIMTKTYNVTKIGVKDQLASRFTKFKEGRSIFYKLPSIIKGETVSISNLELCKIAEIIHKAIFKVYPSLEFIYKYFINMTKLFNKLEIPVIWLTPSGLEIVQKYYRSKQNKVAINFAGRTKNGN
jgi:DNA-directed RNA polymerase, mitochondrial